MQTIPGSLSDHESTLSCSAASFRGDLTEIVKTLPICKDTFRGSGVNSKIVRIN
ncbi:hypothetical protein SAMN04488132_103212 [Sediminibacterium ginsengisoli]|uniref:Uncharacterized protein n=1 Tax=Sediminibacterium ginsengisoli TaxID=413434 RepID=A0A1T4M709_9BACT|nr:hypothetical protein SAMN04488132_103212 [Sediminibacterium ginsengisoli]